ncbi:MAG: PAS domain S-box protein [Candidatus Aminicenantia bacterium]
MDDKERDELERNPTEVTLPYKELIERANDIIYSLDEEGYITYSNREASEYLGYSKDEILNLHFSELIPEKYHKQAFKLLQTTLKNGEIRNAEIIVRKKNGEEVWMECNSRAIVEEGKVVRVIGVLRDINYRKKAEELFLKKEKEYQVLFERTGNATAIVDQEFRLLRVNKKFTEMTGFSEKEMKDKISFFELFPEYEKNRVYIYYQNRMEEKKEEAPFRCELMTKNKEIKSVEIDFQFIPEVKRAVVNIQDLTEQKKLEEQILHSEKLSTLGQMIASIAHELNNPLSAVVGFSELLLGAECQGETREMLEKINNDAQRCHRIINNLLSIVRSRTFEKKYIDINEVVEKTLEIKNYELKIDNIKVEKKLAPELPRTMADWHQIQQAVLNLINNAHYAMVKEKGEGKLIIGTKLKESKILIEISDDGPGIPEDALPKIFDPFFTTKEDTRSAGLGLSIVQRIIRDHQGEIRVSSEVGQGSTFTVGLPVFIEEELVQGEERPSPEKEISKIEKKVLIVEDEPSVADLFKYILNKYGCEVEIARNGMEAFKILQEREFDFIISDIRMPGMDGKMLYKTIKQRNMFKADSIILTSGDILGDQTQEFIRASKIKFLPKPFRERDLLEILEEILHRKD